MLETITNTETVYDGRLVKVDLLDVQLPDGEQGKREVVRHPGAVAMVAVDREHNVLLVRQYRIAAQKVVLEIPAGTLEPDETPEQCAIRELQEETGYRPHQVEALGGIYTAPGYTTEYIHLFYMTDLEESTLEMDNDEFIEVEKLPLKTAVSRIDSGEITDGKTVSGLLRVARRLGV